MLRKLLITLALCFIFLLIFCLLNPSRTASLKQFFYYEPCLPQTVYIGIFDARFDINYEQFEKQVIKATSIWNNAYGKTLFIYDPKGSLPINLTYDKKRFLVGLIDTRIASSWNNLTYQQKLYVYNNHVNEFNKNISLWNKDDKKDSEIYQDLVDYKQIILLEKESLLKENSKLITQNFFTRISNEFLSEGKDIEIPEQGLYSAKPRKIDIYFFNNNSESVHTIAHELGHSISMNHNDNTNSIMYFQASKTTTPTAEDIRELKKACRPKTILEVIWDILSIIPLNFWHKSN